MTSSSELYPLRQELNQVLHTGNTQHMHGRKKGGALGGRARPKQHMCAGSTCSNSAKFIWSELCVEQDPVLLRYTVKWTISHSLQGLLSAEFHFVPPACLFPMQRQTPTKDDWVSLNIPHSFVVEVRRHRQSK